MPNIKKYSQEKLHKELTFSRDFAFRTETSPEEQEWLNKLEAERKERHLDHNLNV